MSTVLSRTESGVAWLTLDRPEAGNTVNFELADDLFAALTAAKEDEAVRCIVLGASGKLFCGGGDLSAFGDAPEDMPDKVSALANALHRSILLIDEMEKPVVTVIQGAAAGAGLVLAACGDIALASDRARFVPAYGKINLTPDGGSTWLLPRLMGERRAMEMLLTGRSYSAEEALEAGLVTRVVAGDRLEEEARNLARDLAGAPAWAMGQTRRLVRTGRTAALRAHLDDEARTIGSAVGRPEGQAAVAAFLKKA